MNFPPRIVLLGASPVIFRTWYLVFLLLLWPFPSCFFYLFHLAFFLWPFLTFLQAAETPKPRDVESPKDSGVRKRKGGQANVIGQVMKKCQLYNFFDFPPTFYYSKSECHWHCHFFIIFCQISRNTLSLHSFRGQHWLFSANNFQSMIKSRT